MRLRRCSRGHAVACPTVLAVAKQVREGAPVHFDLDCADCSQDAHFCWTYELPIFQAYLPLYGGKVSGSGLPGRGC